MSLVVARIDGDRIAIASDTMVTEHDRRLLLQRGVIKSCMLPGNICVSFANSPDLAARDFKMFVEQFPQGTSFAGVISFLEKSSDETGNDYIVAFARPPKLVKIANGQRISGPAKTLWIGDKEGYERFREYEAKHRKGMESGRAINGVILADELPRSPASDLYSTMRHIVADPQVASVGGFVCIVSNRDDAFRHSVYSDMLFGWPVGEADDFVLQLTDKIDFSATGENSNFSTTQISTGFLGLNLAAFYLLTPKKLFLFYGQQNGLANMCLLLNDVEPAQIRQKLTERLGLDFKWLLLVASAAGSIASSGYRSPVQDNEDHGAGFAFRCLANTFPKTQKAAPNPSRKSEKPEHS